MGINTSVDKRTLSTLMEISKLLDCSVEEAANLLLDRYSENSKGEFLGAEKNVEYNDASKLLELNGTNIGGNTRKDAESNIDCQYEEQISF
ncbi:hypothetical protein QA612_20125 [Evansella sp. AB-P1]|uniref:hypothetical protein n=1 Tax=Evansella sp. AB-P1 TaxID=3037653 RepID=UPI00241F1274|nr:hypothetical protein [Evansella sp. AB-P1]MDG5789770.1 hypothetical protein [Evansella sp. AB-P1]